MSNSPSAIPLQSGSQPSLRVLVADDNATNQKLAEHLLRRMGHTTAVANNGTEAVTLSAEQTFDVILMDMEMPDMTGLEATRRIREREAATPGLRLPIIAVTANASSADARRCQEAGMDAYLTKPLRQNELVSALSTVLTGAASTSAVARSGTDRTASPPATQPSLTLIQFPRTGADSSDSSVVFDYARSIQQVDNDAALFADVVQAFLDQKQRLTIALDEAVRARMPDQIRHAAHTIKGATSVFYALPARDAAARVEEMGRTASLEHIDEAHAHLRRELDRLAGALETSFLRKAA